MNWDDLKCFLGVARAGQILGASRRLGVSQSTLNRRISTLEKSLGAVLFNRTTAGCELTPEGQNLLARAEVVEAETLKMKDDLHSGSQEVSGTVRIGAPDGFGVAFLATRLGQLVDSHPMLTVQLVPVPRSFSLSRREADIAITIGRPQKGLLRTKKLIDYQLSLFGSREYLKKRGSPNSIRELAHHRLVGHVDDLIYSKDLDYKSEFWTSWTSTVEISGSLGQLQAVKSGAGIGILHDFMAADDPELCKVVPEAIITRSYWMAWHETQRDSAAVRAVRKFMESTVNEARVLFGAQK